MTGRVLHVISALTVGGAEVMLHSLLSRMDTERFEPLVISLAEGGPMRRRIKELGVPVHDLGMRPGLSATPAVMRRLVRLTRDFRPDVVQGWMYYGNLAAVAAAASCLPRRVPVVWGVHHSLNDLGLEKRSTAAAIRLGARLSTLPKRILYVSGVSASQHEALGYRSDSRVIIPNGFDCDKLRPDAEAYASVRAELGLGPATLLIGSFARYHPMKDHANFLAAASMLVERDPQIRFLLAGRGVDASNKELAARISAPELRGRVYLLGERDDVPRLAAALDVASTSSAWGEAFPIAIGEAMACGVPCVVTDVGDSAWLLGETGRVVPPRDSAALAGAWQDVLRMGKKERVALGARARGRIRYNFSLPEVVRRYEELYAGLAGAERVSSPAKTP